MKRNILIFILILCPNLAWGFVPTVDELLTDITARRVYLNSLEAVYEFSMPAGESSSEPTAREIIDYSAPDRIRLTVAYPDREEVFLAVGIRSMTLTADQTAEARWPQSFLVFRLLIESEAPRFRELLADFGFNLQKISLGRDRDRIVYIIGARSGDLSHSQLWIDRETLRITRIILVSGSDKPGYDLLLSDYNPHDKGVDWPHTLISRAKEEPTLNLRLKNLTVNPKEGAGTSAAGQPSQTDNTQTGPVQDPERLLDEDPEIITLRKMLDKIRKKLQ